MVLEVRLSLIRRELLYQANKNSQSSVMKTLWAMKIMNCYIWFCHQMRRYSSLSL